MGNSAFQRAMKLAVVTGMRSMLGPALHARVTHRPESRMLAIAAIGEMAMDKIPLVPSRDSLISLAMRGIAGAWVASNSMKSEEGECDPWVGPLGAAVATGVAVAAPKIRKTLSWTLDVPDPLLGLLEDYLALRLGSEAVGLTMEQLTQVARDSVEELKERVAPVVQSVGAGSM